MNAGRDAEADKMFFDKLYNYGRVFTKAIKHAGCRYGPLHVILDNAKKL
jgi:hypothetical protein